MSHEIKKYYADEVAKAHTPPFRSKAGSSGRRENSLLGLCAAAAILLLFTPGISESEIRNINFSETTTERFMEQFSPGIRNIAACVSKER